MRKFLFFLLALLPAFYSQSQILLSGKVVSSDEMEPIEGVSVLVGDKGTITDNKGFYSFSVNASPPIALFVSHISYKNRIISLKQDQYQNFLIILEKDMQVLNELVVFDKKIDSATLRSDVPVQKLDYAKIKAIPSYDFYDAVANMREVDVTTQSIMFKSVNTRGFNSHANTRFSQYVDNIDMQAPGLNFSLGNFLGPNELDIEEMQLVPGASSIQYANAINGVLEMKTKDPFVFTGLSAYVKQGFHKFKEGGGSRKMFEIESSNIIDFGLRYAHNFNNKVAVKVTGRYLKTDDWEANDYTNIGAGEDYEITAENPGYNGLNIYGDEINSFLILGDSNKLVQVNRTGYKEEDLIDYNVYNYKLSGRLDYRISEKNLLSISNNFSIGSTVLTADNRVALKDLQLNQFRVSFSHTDALKMIYYNTYQRLDNSFDIGLLAVGLMRYSKIDREWFKHYEVGYEGNPAFNIPFGSNDHKKAREFADKKFNAFAIPNHNRLEPGTPEFEEQANFIKSKLISNGGARLIDYSNLHHAQVDIDLKEFIKVLVVAGINYRFYNPETLGTVFSDTIGNDLTMYEAGTYALYKKNLGSKYFLNLGGRVDKNENFNPVANFRASLLRDLGKDENLRITFKTGSRTPSLREQFIDQQFGNKRLLGGLQELKNYYRLKDFVVYKTYADEFTNRIITLTQPKADDVPAQQIYEAQQSELSILEAGIVEDAVFDDISPEKVYSLEFGYRKLFLKGRLYADINYYLNRYVDLIGYVDVVKTATSPEVDLFLAANQLNDINQREQFAFFANSLSEVWTQGISLYTDYTTLDNFIISVVFDWNQIYKNDDDPIVPAYNTPSFRFNFSLEHREIVKNAGFKYTLRMRSPYLWESTFASGEVEGYSVSDLQFNIKIPKMNSKIQFGFSNVGNEYYSDYYGGPKIGAIVYGSLTYEITK